MADLAVDAALARRALSLLDLTELRDGCHEEHVEALLGRALDPIGPPAALCVWPQFVGPCARRTAGRGRASIPIATVMNFPDGTGEIDRVLDDMQEALGDGAGEIDLVMPRRAFLAGDERPARTLIEAAKLLCGDAPLKVILETGELPDLATVERAARLAAASGADMLKTSTGKTAVSATPEAAEALLRVAADTPRPAGQPLGVKVSGGVRSLADAAAYLALADRIMGPGWAAPGTFRFGASALHDALRAAIEDGPG